MVTYGLMLNAVNIGVDMYINMVLIGAASAVAILMVQILLERFKCGRKKTNFVMMLITAVLLLLLLAVPDGNLFI